MIKTRGWTRGVGRATSPRRAAAGLVLGVAIPAVLTLSGCGRHTGTPSAQPREVSATILTVLERDVPIVVSATGSVEPETRVEISTRMMGWVRRVHVAEGDVVRKGSPLLAIDDADLKARHAQVEAQIAEASAVVANAEAMAARFEKLYADKAVSKQQLDDVTTGRARAQAGLAAALAAKEEVDVHLRYLAIASPVDGLVVRKLVEPGNLASPGHPLLVIEQVGRMKIVARLGEKDIGAVAAGDTVTVEVTSLPGAAYRAPVARVIPSANPGSRTYDLEIYVDNLEGRLKSGMFARVRVPVGRRLAVVVPGESVIERGQLRGLFVVDSRGAARLRWVRLGHEVPGGVEVLSGLTAGERIVVAPAQPLIDGDRIATAGDGAGTVR